LSFSLKELKTSLANNGLDSVANGWSSGCITASLKTLQALIIGKDARFPSKYH
jgi:hypothetical protein